MFLYLHYSGQEPQWAQSLRGVVPAFTPAYSFASQEGMLTPLLENKGMADACVAHKAAFQLDEGLFKPLSEVREVLLEADHLRDTNHLVWRDQWLLGRASAVIVENGATMEIPLLAALWGIPVVAISFTSIMQPWLAKTAQITVNNPMDTDQILNVLGIRVHDLRPETNEREQTTEAAVAWAGAVSEPPDDDGLQAEVIS